jgi:hypothetical protein
MLLAGLLTFFFAYYLFSYSTLTMNAEGLDHPRSVKKHHGKFSLHVDGQEEKGGHPTD